MRLRILPWIIRAILHPTRKPPELAEAHREFARCLQITNAKCQAIRESQQQAIEIGRVES